MNRFFCITAIIELGAGLALLVLPSDLVWLLVGEPLDVAAAQIVARVGGAALVALGTACGIASGDAHGRAAHGLVGAMLFYNVAVVVILAYARIAVGLNGIAMWPAVILHLTMTVWGATLLFKIPSQIAEKSI